MKIRVKYVERFNKKGQPYLKAIVRWEDEPAEIRWAAEDYIETGYWGCLTPEDNQFLVKYRDRYLAKVAERGYATDANDRGVSNFFISFRDEHSTNKNY